MIYSFENKYFHSIISSACGCSLFGSVREDCEQMTGRCVCKPDIQGQKCTICTDHNKILTLTGCYSGIIRRTDPTLLSIIDAKKKKKKKRNASLSCFQIPLRSEEHILPFPKSPRINHRDNAGSDNSHRSV